MRDKLTKKRVKVDYQLVIAIAHAQDRFLSFVKSKKSKISFNRLAYAFCKHEGIDVDGIFTMCLERGFKTYDEWLQETIRVAQDHSWIEN